MRAFQWLQLFDEHTKDCVLQRGYYRFLFMDNHPTHVAFDFIDYCQKHTTIPCAISLGYCIWWTDGGDSDRAPAVQGTSVSSVLWAQIASFKVSLPPKPVLPSRHTRNLQMTSHLLEALLLPKVLWEERIVNYIL